MPTDAIAPAADRLAFERYQQTDAYHSTEKQIRGNVEGCLWSAFYAGRRSVVEEMAAARVAEALATAIKDELRSKECFNEVFKRGGDANNGG